MVTSLRQEKITLGLTQWQIDAVQLDDNADALQEASDKVRADRHNIASTYAELTGGKNFDPTNTKELIWAQALNLENSFESLNIGFWSDSNCGSSRGFHDSCSLCFIGHRYKYYGGYQEKHLGLNIKEYIDDWKEKE
jgi:hypothetical protein